jgi:hypothetical protein
MGSAFGQGTGAFSNASLGASVFGVQSNSSSTLLSVAAAFAAAGMFTTDPGSGTFSGVADDNEFDYQTVVPEAPISGSYNIASNGYGSLTITPGDLGDVSALGIYMTDPMLNLNDPNNTSSGLGGALVADLDGFILNGAGVLTPQTDTATTSFAGSYAFGAQAYNDLNPLSSGREFDFVGQGSIKKSELGKATGLISDPFFAFSNNTTDSGVTFGGIAAPDGVNAGRYTMRLYVTVPGVSQVGFSVVFYQASGGQLFWLDENADGNSVFLGPFQQQGSLTAIPAARKTAAKTRTKPKQ